MFFFHFSDTNRQTERPTKPLITPCVQDLKQVTTNLHHTLIFLQFPSIFPLSMTFTFSLYSYDFLWLVRTVARLGNKTIKTPTSFGTFHEKRLLLKPAKVIMRDANTVISCKFRFTCPDGHLCKPCTLKSKTSSDKDSPKPICLTESREFVFLDSYLHINASLSKCIDDLRDVAFQTKTPLQKQFPATYNFASVHCNYTHTQFLEIVKGKLIFPFNLAQSIHELQNITTIPPREAFTDKLNNNKEISLSDYTHFCSLWKTLKFKSLLHCLWTYNLLDAGMYYSIHLFMT